MCLAHGWVKDVEAVDAVKRSPDKVEKLTSPIDIYQLLLWSLNKFQNYTDNYSEDETEDARQIKRTMNSKLSRDFLRRRRMRGNSFRMTNSNSMDPLASGLIG